MVGSLYQAQECQNWGSLFQEREGAEVSLLIPTTTPPSTPPQPLGRGFPPSSSPHSPSPLEDCSPPRRHQEASLRQPCTMPCCLQPHGHFPAPPPYAFHDLNAPHIMMTYSPQLQYPLPVCNCFCDPNPNIYPQNLFP